MGRYAEGTTVSVERSKQEIETTVRRYGATSFISGYDEQTAFVLFRADDRMVRFHVAIPAPADPRFARDGRKNNRTPEQRQKAAPARTGVTPLAPPADGIKEPAGGWA